MATGMARLLAELNGEAAPGNAVATRMEQGTVTALTHTGEGELITVNWRGSAVPAFYMDGYAPAVGDVALLMVQQGQLVALGRVSTGARAEPAEGLPFVNTAEGGVPGETVTLDNSGGDSGTAFTFLTTSIGGCAYTSDAASEGYASIRLQQSAVGWQIPAGHRQIGARASFFLPGLGVTPQTMNGSLGFTLVFLGFGNFNFSVGVGPGQSNGLRVHSHPSLSDRVVYGGPLPLGEWWTLQVGADLDTARLAVAAFDVSGAELFSDDTGEIVGAGESGTGGFDYAWFGPGQPYTPEWNAFPIYVDDIRVQAEPY